MNWEDIGVWATIVSLIGAAFTGTGFLWKLVVAVGRVAEEMKELKDEVKEANREFREALTDHGTRIARLEGRTDVAA